MFTGLIQGLGKVSPLSTDRFAITLMVHGEVILSTLQLGDSVAVDGICLTVEEIMESGFVATASPETLSRTTLGRSAQFSHWVNIEPSLRVGGKLGGHFVSGHVDGMGSLLESVQTDRAWEMIFASPPSLQEFWQESIAPFLVAKGSIAVNGISLTVSESDRQGKWFKTAVIPHTYQETNLSFLKQGDWVNLESDILGKYVDRIIRHRFQDASSSDISLSFLTEHGYL